MLVSHLTLPVSNPVLPAPQPVENPGPATRSVVLTPLQEPTGMQAGASLKNPNPMQTEVRQQNQRASVVSQNGEDTGADVVDASSTNGAPGEQPVEGAEQKENDSRPGQEGQANTRGDEGEKPVGEQSATGLTDEELSEVRELAARDREVRAHEQAHAAVGGSLAGSASYSFENGPDGRQYAVAGEVAIDVSPVPNNPEATIRKAQQIRRAAQAPADPSPQDRFVATQAIQMEIQARLELAEQRQSAFNRDERSSAAIDAYEKLVKIGRSQDLFPDLENVIDARA